MAVSGTTQGRCEERTTELALGDADIVVAKVSGSKVARARDMGSKGSAPRKRRQHLPKVPHGEEPNVAPLSGLAHEYGVSAGRDSHNLEHAKQPGRVGQWFLRALGKKPGHHI